MTAEERKVYDRALKSRIETLITTVAQASESKMTDKDFGYTATNLIDAREAVENLFTKILNILQDEDEDEDDTVEAVTS